MSSKRDWSASGSLALSVRFGREQVFHYTNVKRKAKTTQVYANSPDNKRFFAVKNTAQASELLALQSLRFSFKSSLKIINAAINGFGIFCFIFIENNRVIC